MIRRSSRARTAQGQLRVEGVRPLHPRAEVLDEEAPPRTAQRHVCSAYPAVGPVADLIGRRRGVRRVERDDVAAARGHHSGDGRVDRGGVTVKTASKSCVACRCSSAHTAPAVVSAARASVPKSSEGAQLAGVAGVGELHAHERAAGIHLAVTQRREVLLIAEQQAGLRVESQLTSTSLPASLCPSAAAAPVKRISSVPFAAVAWTPSAGPGTSGRVALCAAEAGRAIRANPMLNRTERLRMARDRKAWGGWVPLHGVR